LKFREFKNENNISPSPVPARVEEVKESTKEILEISVLEELFEKDM
jgi:hypothetical protein